MLAAFVAGLVESADLTLLPLFGLHPGLVSARPCSWSPYSWRATWCCRCRSASRRSIWPQSSAGDLRTGELHRALLLPPCIVGRSCSGRCCSSGEARSYAFYSQGVALLGEEFATADLARANTVFVMVYCLGGVIGPSAAVMPWICRRTRDCRCSSAPRPCYCWWELGLPVATVCAASISSQSRKRAILGKRGCFRTYDQVISECCRRDKRKWADEVAVGEVVRDEAVSRKSDA